MTTTQTELDGLLLANLIRQDLLYSHALEIAVRLPDAFATGQQREELLNEFARISQEIELIDQETITAKKSYYSTRHKPSAQLNEAMFNVSSKIEQLIKLIDQSEQIAREVKQRLTPELDNHTKMQRMRRAYATNLEPRVED